MFHGLRVGAIVAYSVEALKPNSGMVLLPSTPRPVLRNWAVNGSSAVAGRDRMASEPMSVGRPATLVLSLMMLGTPDRMPGAGVRDCSSARSRSGC